MPTYEYRCTVCGCQYERREGFDAPASQKCPRCGAESRRVLYAPPILFKGSGFYVTDNRKSGLAGSSTGSGSNGDGEKEIASIEPASTAEAKAADKPKAEKKTSDAAAG